ncbi:UNVERIFIED_CONTAM: hypothetical protein K2H54_028295 [Gekko kuhli]
MGDCSKKPLLIKNRKPTEGQTPWLAHSPFFAKGDVFKLQKEATYQQQHKVDDGHRCKVLGMETSSGCTSRKGSLAYNFLALQDGGNRCKEQATRRESRRRPNKH